MLESILFLPAAYWLVLIGSAIVTGLVFKASRNVLLTTLLLFVMFSVPQLVYRVNNGEAPERLVGQVVYFATFLVIAGTTTEILARRNT